MKIIASLAPIIYLLSNLLNAYSYNICDANMINASKMYIVPLPILYAVSMTEAGLKQTIQPYALNIDGNSIFPQTKNEALKQIDLAKQRGAKYIDVGCMQINLKYHGKHFKSVNDMLDPTININYAAKFLKNLYERQGSWTIAVARYHTGDHNKKEQKKYVCKVIRNLIATGFGGQIKEASRFCNNF